ncbi:hypothetical protein BGX24_008775 [Mortierella sp. AD032]|nr:hypothetical protein BGX24_008775 [Mortierella sp. AD032]
MAYTTVDENTLYIHGGMDTITKAVSGQFYALDLTVPAWDTSSPPWRQVTSNGIVPPSVYTASGTSASLSQDHKTISFWSASSDSTKAITNFNLATGTWETIPAPVLMANSYFSLPATTDPNTGLVYVPNGFADKTMMVYNPLTRTTTSLPMPPMLLSDWFPAVWSSVRGTVLVLGGEGAVLSYFYEFKPPSGPWTEVKTTGPMPGNMIRSCMVSAYNGSKIIHFGGNTTPTTSIGTISILDVATMTWTQGPSIDPSLHRSSMACGVSGDNVVIWGGYQWEPVGPTRPVSGTPLIYNLFTGKWTQQYIRGNHYMGAVAPSVTPTIVATTLSTTAATGVTTKADDKISKDGDAKSNVAAIGAGIAGAVVVFAGIAFFIFRKRRSSKHQPSQPQQQQHQVQHNIRDNNKKMEVPFQPTYAVPTPVPIHITNRPGHNEYPPRNDFQQNYAVPAPVHMHPSTNWPSNNTYSQPYQLESSMAHTNTINNNNISINSINGQMYGTYSQPAQVASQSQVADINNSQAYNPYPQTAQPNDEQPISYKQVTPVTIPASQLQAVSPVPPPQWQTSPQSNIFTPTWPLSSTVAGNTSPTATATATTTTISSPSSPTSAVQSGPVYSTTINNPQDHQQQSQHHQQQSQHHQQQQQHQYSVPSNPQYFPHGQEQDSLYMTTAPIRGPQGVGDPSPAPMSVPAPASVPVPVSVPVYATSDRELQEHIELMQAELNRRQAGL